jgi:hypothetical protein
VLLAGARTPDVATPSISVAVLAAHVAGVLSFHNGPPGMGLQPLLKTLIDNELATPSPVSLSAVISAAAARHGWGEEVGE